MSYIERFKNKLNDHFWCFLSFSQKLDPNQFLQVHGRPCKIYLDPAIAAAAEAQVVEMTP